MQNCNMRVTFQCHQCPYKATRTSNLVDHLKSVHDGVKYPCDQCPYEATKKSDLLLFSLWKKIN